MPNSDAPPAPKRGRGRPRNATKPQLKKADRAIARTVDRLIMWGYSKGQVLPCVAAAAQYWRAARRRIAYFSAWPKLQTMRV